MAYFILSKPEKRDQYDAQLEKADRTAMFSGNAKLWGGLAAVLIVLVGGINYYVSERAKTRERLAAKRAKAGL